MKKYASDLFIGELNMLRNRLEAGESLYQCLSTMGTPLEAPPNIKNKFLKLSHLLLEGRTISSLIVKAFSDQIESEKKLIQLVDQKTLSPKIQAFIIAGISGVLIFSSYWLFPAQFKVSLSTFIIAFFMCGASLYTMKTIIKNFEKQLYFLEWIFFLRSLQLSLKCGLSLPTAVNENFATAENTKKIPQSFLVKIKSLEIISLVDSNVKKNSLWTMAARTWNTLLESQEKGLPLSDMLDRSLVFQEGQFKTWILMKSEKISFVLLIPLFLLSLPSALLILLAPLLNAISE
jgi:hypothetical protein